MCWVGRGISTKLWISEVTTASMRFMPLENECAEEKNKANDVEPTE